MATVKLNIADVILALAFKDPQAAGSVKSFYQGFEGHGPPDVSIEVNWHGSYEFENLSHPIPGAPAGSASNGVYSVAWEHYSGSYCWDAGSGCCTVRGFMGLSHFLWALWAWLMPRYQGALLHASSLSDNGLAYVFPAKSGTGKSTLVRNSPEFSVLSDEGSLVRLVHGSLLAYGSPFRSDNFRDHKWTRVPVAGIYFLEQAPEDRLISLSKAEGLERLVQQTFLSSTDGESRRRTFHTLLDLTQTTELSLLRLLNSPGFWRCIRRDN